MFFEVVIKVAQLSKCYRIYSKPQERLLQMLTRSRKQYGHEFWALKDVSFEVKKGETVGIIGRNGSGKSTLLQMICGTLNPTAGKIVTQGRIAALLELGSGFNPEFTGRENVYMNASVLGLSKEETCKRFDDIVAFAEINEFIDQPVKTYSSGMMVRLAFAVAINVDPEILIVDEALSVGDERFQRKCFSRIESIRASGATILFVSHSGAQIIELCDRAILIDQGKMIIDGFPKQVVGYYQKLLYAPADKRDLILKEISDLTVKEKDQVPTEEVAIHEAQDSQQEFFDSSLKPSSNIEYESQGAYIDSPSLFSLSGKKVNNLLRGKVYRYCYQVRFTRDVKHVRFGMLIKTTSGFELGGGVSTNASQSSFIDVKAGSTYKIEFQFCCSLTPGTYFLNAGVLGYINDEEIYLHRLIDIAMFRVQTDIDSLATGIVDFSCSPLIKKQEELCLEVI
ncbi:Teichoic acids export ATP-binding protein TagH [Legionella massiliensis]|uniref:Teichoic acids export ATP-binding protein TagH n=1 Tax=Legionella massiliensis TaxID=1034943 RepID=A0A078KWT9_9GAMM|nr:ABC transporter ATP-binding protein [Legionella massiliensis]CDZ76234.1 Teichoic acids export ATP-binding protein TagH [Legionella massiliensis]CEE11972.1 Teichoic acids export ATP-binding protein TagH [Legionella massiliensis]